MVSRWCCIQVNLRGESILCSTCNVLSRSLGCYLLVVITISVPALILTLGTRYGSDGRALIRQQSSYEDERDSVPALDLNRGRPNGEGFVATIGRSESPVAIHGGSETHVNDTG